MKNLRNTVCLFLALMLALGTVPFLPSFVSTAFAATRTAELNSDWAELQYMIDSAVSGATITLTKDVTAQASDTRLTVSGKTLTLDLNGFTLDRGRTGSDATASGSVIYVTDGAELTVTDSSAANTGVITGGSASKGGGIYVDEDSRLCLEGGTISGNSALNYGGGVYIDAGAVFNMSGGTVSYNSADDCGGGIYVDYNSYGEALPGTLDMSGGTVYGNSAENRGGGVSNNGTVNLTGGRIAGNYAPKGGGLDCTDNCDALNVSGSPVVEGNVNGNVYLFTDKVIYVVGGLTDKAKLDVEGFDMPRVITIGFGTSGSPASAFSFLYGSVSLKTEDDELVPDMDMDMDMPVTAYTWDELQDCIIFGGNRDKIINVGSDLDGTGKDSLILDGDSVTINLNGHDLKRTSAGDTKHVFEVRGGATLTVIDTSGVGGITGGWDENGGGIYVENGSTVKLVNVNIYGNKANGKGGAVYILGTLEAYGCNFRNNAAGDEGGAIYCAGGVVNLTATAITNNTSVNGGGAVNIRTSDDDDYTAHFLNYFNYCRITNNKSTNSDGDGGGLYVDMTDGALFVTDCFITGNTAGDLGGGVYIDEGYVELTDGCVSDNSAHDGGGVYIDEGYVYFIDSCVSDNSAHDGGGVYIDEGDVYFMDSCVSDNSAYDGGGVYIDDGDVRFINSCVSNNSALEGGAVYINGSDTIITNTVIKNNRAAYDGGGIYFNGGTLVLTNVTITDNVCCRKGGGIYHAAGDENLSISLKVVIKNNSAREGNDVYLTGSKLLKLVSYSLSAGSKIGVAAENVNRKITKDFGTYHPSDDPYTFFIPEGERSVIIEDGEVKLMDSDWSILQDILNSAANGETVVLNKDWKARLSTDTHLIVDGDKSVTLDLAGHTIDRNCAFADAGGEVITVGGTCTLTIIDSVGGGRITGGCGTNGGGIYVDENAALNLVSGEISGNRASMAGGGIYNNGGTVTISGGVISGNTVTGTASGSGGGIWSNGTLNISAGTVAGNRAGCDGGGVYLEGNANVSGGTFTNNTAGRSGGAILLSDAPYCTLSVQGSPVIETNCAPAGNGLFLRGANKINITGALDSSAKLDLAAQNIGRELTTGLSGNGELSNFTYNGLTDVLTLSANGEIFVEKITADITVSSWDELQAALSDTDNDGRTIALDSSISGEGRDCLLIEGAGRSMTIELGGFSIDMGRTSSGGSKHVIEAKGGATLTVRDTYGTGMITGGWTDDGGGVYVNRNSTVELIGVSVTGNRATRNGGGIYVRGTLIMTGGEISANTSDDSGGAVYVENIGRITLEGVTISGNTSVNSGGGLNIHVKDNTSAIRNCTVTGNVSSTDSGGGLYFKQSGREITLENNIITNNTCGGNGGGIYVDAGKVIIKGADTLISGNSAENGGGIFSDDKLTIQAGTISENCAEHDGGGVYSKGETVISGGTIEKNTAHRSGGGMRVRGGTVTVSGGTVSENTADESGGGICLNNGCTLVMSGGSIRENEALLEGGGVLVGDSVTAVELSGNAAVFGNTASTGYDMYLRDDLKLTVTGAFGSEAKIGVTFHDFKSGDRFTEGYLTNNPSASPSSYFFSNDGYGIGLIDNEAALSIPADEGVQFIPRNEQIKTDIDKLSSMNWMSGISGERRLNEINIPGSHDSGMRSLYDFTQSGGDIADAYAKYAYTQRRYIDEQLEDGIRVLDIRLNNRHVVKDSLLPFVRRLVDDGVNLWLTHGRDMWAGTFFAMDRDGSELSLNEVLTYVKDFLKNHPSEVVIIEFSLEILKSDLDKYTDTTEWRLMEVLRELSTEINPSTGKPYLYTEDGVFGKSMTCYPKLKDCRGQIVANYQGGFDWDMSGNYDVLEPEGETNESAETRIGRVTDFFYRYGMPDLPTNASEHYDFVYRVKTESADPAADTPLELADKIHPALYGEGNIYDPTNAGKYVGFVSMDGADAKDARCVWMSNFFDGLEYCDVTAMSGFNNTDLYPDQTFRLLKYTPITLPDCIYEADPAQGLRFVGWRGSDGNLYTPGMTYVLENSTTFTAEFTSGTAAPIQIVWMDGDNCDGYRPEALTLNINSELNIELTAAGHWRTICQGDISSIVPVWELIEVTSQSPHGWDNPFGYSYVVTGGQGEGYVITLYHTPQPTFNLAGSVLWNDEDDYDWFRPDSVTVHLYKNGSELNSTTATGAENWSFSFGTVAGYEDGQRVYYTITQDPVDYYSTAASGLYVLNSHCVERKYLSVGVSWIDNENPSRPESVTVRLYNNDELVESHTASADDYDAWAYDFDVTEFISETRDAAPNFRVSVETPDGYEREVNSAGDGFTVRFAAEGLPSFFCEDVLEENAAVSVNGENLIRYKVKVDDLPAGAQINGAEIYLSYDSEELEFRMGEGIGDSDWTFTEKDGLLSAVWTGGGPEAVSNGDTVLTLYFLKTGDADKVDIGFTNGGERRLSGVSYVLNGLETNTEVRTYGGSINFTHRLYTVAFDANGGMGDMEDQLFTAGSAQALTACGFVNDEMVFVGWNTQADGLGVTYADRASVKDLAAAGGSVTLYALWRPEGSPGFNLEDSSLESRDRAQQDNKTDLRFRLRFMYNGNTISPDSIFAVGARVTYTHDGTLYSSGWMYSTSIKVFSSTDEYFEFTMVISGIPNENSAELFSVDSYIMYNNNGVETRVNGITVSGTIDDIPNSD